MINNILDFFNRAFKIGSFCFYVIIFAMILWLIKLIIYKRFGYIEIIGIIIVLIPIAIIPIFSPALQIVTVIYSFLLLAYVIYDFIIAYLIYNIRQNKVGDFIKNASYDYYFATNKKDIITDVSLSYCNLTGLEIKDLKLSKGFQTMISRLKIVKLNERELTPELTLSFNHEYDKAVSQLKTYKFEIEILENNKVNYYQVIVQPVFFKKHFLGRNVFFNRNRKNDVVLLRENLRLAMDDFRESKNQTYALMSVSESVIMYYDFHSNTYVATEALNNFLNNKQKEFSIEEFFGLIHPQDMKSYEQIGATINSTHMTRLRFRMLFNNQYYNVVEDAIYLNKDSGLVSVIKLTDNLIKPAKVDESPIAKKVNTSIFDGPQLEKVNDIKPSNPAYNSNPTKQTNTNVSSSKEIDSEDNKATNDAYFETLNILKGMKDKKNNE